MSFGGGSSGGTTTQQVTPYAPAEPALAPILTKIMFSLPNDINLARSVESFRIFC